MFNNSWRLFMLSKNMMSFTQLLVHHLSLTSTPWKLYFLGNSIFVTCFHIFWLLGNNAWTRFGQDYISSNRNNKPVEITQTNNLKKNKNKNNTQFMQITYINVQASLSKFVYHRWVLITPLGLEGILQRSFPELIETT